MSAPCVCVCGEELGDYFDTSIDLDGVLYCPDCLRLIAPKLWLMLGGSSGELVGRYQFRTQKEVD